MLDWTYRDDVIKNQLLPDSRSVCFSDTWSESLDDRHKTVCFNASATLTLISGETRIRLFDTVSGNLLLSQVVDDTINCSVFSACERYIYVCGLCAIHRIDLESSTSPSIDMNWFDTGSPIMSMQRYFDSEDLVILSSGGEVNIIECDPFPEKTLVFPDSASKPTAIAISNNLTDTSMIALVNSDTLRVYHRGSTTEAFKYTEGLGDSPVLSIEFISANPLILLVMQKETISFFRATSGPNLVCYHQLADSINRITYLASKVCPGSRPLLALATKDEMRSGNRAKLELLDVTSSPTPLLKFDVSRLGDVSGLSWIPSSHGRSFVSVFSSGCSLLWAPALQMKKDNWQTYVPNLESCGVNVPMQEKESEFDFNMIGDPGVVSRYMKGEREWDFGQGVPIEGAEEEAIKVESVRSEPKYSFMVLDKLSLDKYELVTVNEEGTGDRLFTTTGETIRFEIQ